MLRNCGMVRRKATLSRRPPWRSWLKAREVVPDISFRKSLDVGKIYFSGNSDQNRGLEASSRFATGNNESLFSPDDAPVVNKEQNLVRSVVEAVPQIRKFLVPASPHSRESVETLNRVCDEIRPGLGGMHEADRIRLLSAFGELREYSVRNRVADRYNTGTLSYMNKEFYCALIDSIGWTSVFSTVLSKANSLSPTLYVLRTVSRMGAGNERVNGVFSSVFSDLLKSIDAMSPRPAQLIELIMLASKNRVVHPEIFNHVITDISTNFNGYSHDLLGDLCRSFSTLAFYSPVFHQVLLDQVPTIAHELSWWNLVDIADFFSKNVPAPFSDLDQELAARFSNECWKWIPEMRCGYAAKALRVLTDLNVGDKRTIRSLIRAIPKSLGKLHPPLVAESLVSAVKFGYDPKARYGKRSGSLLYRRLAFRLSSGDGGSVALSRVNADLIIAVVEALSSINRPQPELFDSIVHDISKSPWKYSMDHLVSLQRLFSDDSLKLDRGALALTPVIESRKCNAMDINNLAFLAATSGGTSYHAELLQAENTEIKNHLSVDSVVGLLKIPDFTSKYLLSWLESNLPSLSPPHHLKLLVGLAEHRTKLPTDTIQWINLVSEKASMNSPEESVTLLASFMIINEFQILPPALAFQSVTGKPLKSPEAIEICQLIGALIRLDSSINVHDHLHKFLGWIESHLMSRNRPQAAGSSPVKPWYIPHGAVTDLSVFPVNIPLALPDPRIDLRSLHTSRSPTQIRRIHSDMQRDAGVALLLNECKEQQLKKILRHTYLNRLGWTVEYLSSECDVNDPSLVSMAILGASNKVKHNYSRLSF